MSLAASVPGVVNAVVPPSSPVPWSIDGKTVTGSGFFDDPYSAYPTRLVDGTIASDVAGGTTLTRTWNGVSGTYQVYKSIEFGVADWLTASPRRLGVLATAVYTPAAGIYMPNAGTSDSSRIIIQGDPAATATALPQVFGTNGFVGFSCGSSVSGSASGTQGTARFVTFRKLEIGNIAAGSNGNSCITGGGNFPCDGLVVEYCYLHDAVGTVNNTGGVRVDGVGSATYNPGAIIRYNKFANFNQAGGSRDLNVNCVNSFGAAFVQVYNNSMTNADNGVFIKRPSMTLAPNGWTIRNNVIWNVGQAAIWFSYSGAGHDPFEHNGHRVYQNLIYTCPNGMYIDDNGNTAQNTDFIYYQNTAGEDVGNAIYGGNMTAWQIHSNVSLAKTQHVATVKADAATQVTFCDYNRYLNSGSSLAWELERYGTNTTFSTLASWQNAHTSNASLGDLTANPDAHAAYCLLTDFPNHATRDYTYANGVGQGYGGINIGYDPTNIGPGW
jgi:hypothetical protein